MTTSRTRQEDVSTAEIDAPTPPSGERAVWLHIASGPQAGTFHRLGQGAHILGRSSRSDILLEDEGVSRLHASIVVGHDGAPTLHDLGATNGTFVDGVPVTSARLRDGAVIHLGHAELTLYRFQQREAFTLSPRELEVALAVSEGLTNNQIAQRLCISRRTVNTHLVNIYQRLHISCRSELTRYVVERKVGGRR